MIVRTSTLRRVVAGWTALAILTPLAAFAKNENKQPVAPETWYARVFASSDAGSLVTHYWSKGPLFRAETVVAGHRVANVVNGEFYYAIDLVARTGIRVRRHESAIAEDAKRVRPFGQELASLKALGAERVGEENLDGIECDVYQLTDEVGRRRLWMSRSDPPLPIRLETYVRRTTRSDRLDYVGWLTGLPIADGFFSAEVGLLIKNLEYEDYLRDAYNKQVGPVPVLFRHLLHGPSGGE